MGCGTFLSLTAGQVQVISVWPSDRGRMWLMVLHHYFRAGCLTSGVSPRCHLEKVRNVPGCHDL